MGALLGGSASTVHVELGATGEVKKEVAPYGPGDVKALDARAVVRTVPYHGVHDFEPNLFPCIELAQPELPWLLSPSPDSHGRVSPWLVLVVVEDRPGVTISFGAGNAQILTIEAPAVPGDELPDLAQSWAWAHAQATGTEGTAIDLHAFGGGDDQARSRLIAPRRLNAGSRYIGCVVPAYAAGVAAVLGSGAQDGPAWTGSETSVRLPVYFTWRFATGPGGDFASLVKLVTPIKLGPDMGHRAADISAPRWGVTSVPGATVEVGSALRSPAWGFFFFLGVQPIDDDGEVLSIARPQLAHHPRRAQRARDLVRTAKPLRRGPTLCGGAATPAAAALAASLRRLGRSGGPLQRASTTRVKPGGSSRPPAAHLTGSAASSPAAQWRSTASRRRSVRSFPRHHVGPVDGRTALEGHREHRTTGRRARRGAHRRRTDIPDGEGDSVPPPISDDRAGGRSDHRVRSRGARASALHRGQQEDRDRAARPLRRPEGEYLARRRAGGNRVALETDARHRPDRHRADRRRAPRGRRRSPCRCCPRPAWCALSRPRPSMSSAASSGIVTNRCAVRHRAGVRACVPRRWRSRARPATALAQLPLERGPPGGCGRQTDRRGHHGRLAPAGHFRRSRPWPDEGVAPTAASLMLVVTPTCSAIPTPGVRGPGAVGRHPSRGRQRRAADAHRSRPSRRRRCSVSISPTASPRNGMPRPPGYYFVIAEHPSEPRWLAAAANCRAGAISPMVDLAAGDLDGPYLRTGKTIRGAQFRNDPLRWGVDLGDRGHPGVARSSRARPRPDEWHDRLILDTDRHSCRFASRLGSPTTPTEPWCCAWIFPIRSTSRPHVQPTQRENQALAGWLASARDLAAWRDLIAPGSGRVAPRTRDRERGVRSGARATERRGRRRRARLPDRWRGAVERRDAFVGPTGGRPRRREADLAVGLSPTTPARSAPARSGCCRPRVARHSRGGRRGDGSDRASPWCGRPGARGRSVRDRASPGRGGRARRSARRPSWR